MIQEAQPVTAQTEEQCKQSSLANRVKLGHLFWVDELQDNSAAGLESEYTPSCVTTIRILKLLATVIFFPTWLCSQRT
jgi:hypothetical protein